MTQNSQNSSVYVLYVLVSFELVVNIVNGLYINITMNSTAQMFDSNFEKSGPDKNAIIVRGFSNKYM